MGAFWARCWRKLIDFSRSSLAVRSFSSDFGCGLRAGFCSSGGKSHTGIGRSGAFFFFGFFSRFFSGFFSDSSSGLFSGFLSVFFTSVMIAKLDKGF